MRVCVCMCMCVCGGSRVSDTSGSGCAVSRFLAHSRPVLLEEGPCVCACMEALQGD